MSLQHLRRLPTAGDTLLGAAARLFAAGLADAMTSGVSALLA
jgi:hypothetical protein